MKFTQWLERRESELFHGTTTGPDDERVKSFRQGIKPLSSDGHGQGSGYFAFSDKETAQMHAQSLLGADGPKTNQRHSGSPMVVTHKAKLNPKDYELDKEIQSEDIFKFFKSQEDQIDKMLLKHPVTVEPSGVNGTGTFVEPITLHGMFYHPRWQAIGFWLVNPKGVDMAKVKDGNEFFVIRPNDVNDAADLQQIMTKLLETFPSIAKDYRAFSRTIMKRTGEGRAKDRAWKYVGDKPMQPSNISVKKDSW